MKTLVDKIIFLDIDGVLNSEEWAKKYYNMRISNTAPDGVCDLCDPIAVDRLISLLEETNSKIVLSSSWRSLNVQSSIKEFSTFIHKPFKKLVPYLIGVTPLFRKYTARGNEIDYWMNLLKTDYNLLVKHGYLLEDVEISDNYKYVIVDDDSDMLQNQVFVQTDFRYGLTDKDVEKIKKCLDDTREA